MAGSGSNDSKDSGFDRTGKTVSADASTLVPDISSMKDGWITPGKSTADKGANVLTASTITFVNAGYSQNIVVTIYVYDTVEHAKAAYNSEKTIASGTYKVNDEGAFEESYNYAISGGASYIKQINFRDMNVYGEIYSNSGVVHITDKEFKSVMDDIQDKIIAAAA